MERISTGLPKLDSKLEGGYPEGKGILITGNTGSGKTILGLHLLYQACKNGKNCMFIATEETPEDILLQAESLGLDLRPFYDDGNLVIQRVYEERVYEAISNVEWGTESSKMSTNIIQLKDIIVGTNDVVVIDNIGVFTPNILLSEFRSQFDALNHTLSKRNYTTIFTIDETSNKRTENIASYSVYGIIRMSNKENPYTNKHERCLEVVKMRNTQIPEEPMKFKIRPNKGIDFLSG
ncbi:MAG: RAD55 family ATPase [Methanosarcinales archaeon]|nr:RAD55 family ATPase [Methanosarcinales archaeon]MCD4810368.1 RAD55 family ATPase [Methanosarcinales archaeon]